MIEYRERAKEYEKKAAYPNRRLPYIFTPHRDTEPMPSADRCAAAVHNSFGVGFHQCVRARSKGHFCRQHHPDAIEERWRRSEERYRLQCEAVAARNARYRYRERLADLAPKLIAALREIEAGANNARDVARKALAGISETEGDR